MTLKDQAFSTEVDYEVFATKFWPKNSGRIKLSALNVWTEIFSVIKGGVEQYYQSIGRYWRYG